MSTRWRRFGLAAGWGAVIGWLPMSIVYAYLLQYADGGDFGMYYAAAETLRFSPHSNVFLQQTLTATVLAHGGCGSPPLYPYPYQPLLALLLEPLTYLPCQTAVAVWFVFNFALWFGVSAIYIVRAWRRSGSAQALLVAMMTLFLLPVLSGIGYGQVHLVLLVCILGSVMLIKRDHPYAGGVLLGFGVVLKYFPAILVLYYLLRGRWRVAVGAAAASIALVVAQGLIVGPQTLLESIGAGEADVRYYAAIDEGGHWMNSLPGGVFIGYLAAVAFVATVVWLRWGRGSQASNELVGAGWALATMLMLSPLVWWYYLTWLLPALMICLDVALQYAKQAGSGRGWRALVSRWWPGAALALSYCLLIVIPFHVPHPIYRAPAAGTLLLWLLCGALYLWSAGVRLPGGVPSLRAWRRAPVGVAASNAGGMGASSQ